MNTHSHPPETITRTEVISIPVSEKTRWRHVVLFSADGRSGIGEFSLNTAPDDYDQQMRGFAEQLVGSTASLETLFVYHSHCQQNLLKATLYSALDQALSDLEAQVANTAVHEWLSAPVLRHSVPLYANINRRTLDRTAAGFARSALDATQCGFTAIKIAPFDGLSPQLCGTPAGDLLLETGLRRIESVAQALTVEGIPASTELQVDCHWRLTLATALHMLDRLSEAGVKWLECPIPEELDAIPQLVILRKACNDNAIRLTGLETNVGVNGFKPYIDAQAYDVIMPDIKHAGGYSAIIDIAHYANKHGVATSLHNPSGPIAHTASLHLASLLPGNERLEIQFDESPFFSEITDPSPESIVSGHSILPHSPGLGISLKNSYMTRRIS